MTLLERLKHFGAEGLKCAPHAICVEIISALEERDNLVIAAEFAAEEVKIRNEQIEKLRTVADKMAKVLRECEVPTIIPDVPFDKLVVLRNEALAEYDSLTKP